MGNSIANYTYAKNNENLKSINQSFQENADFNLFLGDKTYNCTIDPMDIQNDENLKIIFIKNNQYIKMPLRLFNLSISKLYNNKFKNILTHYIKNKKLQVEFMGAVKNINDKKSIVVGILYILFNDGKRENINQWILNKGYATVC